MFLNNLNDYLAEHDCLGVNLEAQHGGILTLLKLLTILYADDTFSFATDHIYFQRNLISLWSTQKIGDWILTTTKRR